MIFDGIIKGVGGFLKRREERKKEEALLKVRLVEAGYDSTKGQLERRVYHPVGRHRVP